MTFLAGMGVWHPLPWDANREKRVAGALPWHSCDASSMKLLFERRCAFAVHPQAAEDSTDSLQGRTAPDGGRRRSREKARSFQD